MRNKIEHMIGGGDFSLDLLSNTKGGQALITCPPRLPKGGQRCKGGDSRG